MKYISADMLTSSVDTCQTSSPFPNQLPFVVVFATFPLISERNNSNTEKSGNNIPKAYENRQISPTKNCVLKLSVSWNSNEE